jgi:hypothetical protein
MNPGTPYRVGAKGETPKKDMLSAIPHKERLCA